MREWSEEGCEFVMVIEMLDRALNRMGGVCTLAKRNWGYSQTSLLFAALGAPISFSGLN